MAAISPLLTFAPEYQNGKNKPFLSPSINLYADLWKDYELFNHHSNQKTPDNSLCYRKEFENFSLNSREFSGKTVESKVDQTNSS